MSSLTVYVTVRYKCPDFVDQESVDEFGLLNIVEDMFKDETPAEWTDERPVLVSVSLHPDGESTVADIAAEQGVKPLQDFDALAMPEQSS